MRAFLYEKMLAKLSGGGVYHISVFKIRSNTEMEGFSNERKRIMGLRQSNYFMIKKERKKQ